MIFANFLLLLALMFPPQLQTVAYIEIQVNDEGHYYYTYKVDGDYFPDICKVMTFFSLEGYILCGEEVMMEYARDFTPLPQEQIGTIRKF